MATNQEFETAQQLVNQADQTMLAIAEELSGIRAAIDRSR